MTLKESIDAEAALNTHRRTGWDLSACHLDAKLLQGLWKPEDTCAIVARLWAKDHPVLATWWVKIYLAFKGEKEIPYRG